VSAYFGGWRGEFTNRAHRSRVALSRATLRAMRDTDGPFGLRLAARASDRAKAAEPLWPAFERRLLGLGYSPRSIAHAFSILSGLGTVDEALEALERDET
jgi:hypothetical protein